MRNLAILPVLPVMAALLVFVPVGARTTTQDFDTPGALFVIANFPNSTPSPAVVGPDAFSSGKFLRLLSGGSFDGQNTVGFESQPPRGILDGPSPGAFDRIIADFDFRITCRGARLGLSGGGCADGFSILLLNAAVYGFSGSLRTPSQAEHGILQEGGQFGVGFNTFLNSGFAPDAGSSNSLSMVFNNSIIPGSPTAIPLSTFDLATGTDGNEGAFHHAQIDLVLGGPTPNVTVTLTGANPANVITPISNFDLSGVAGLAPFESRVGFAARCSAGCADYDLDNINVKFLNFAVDIDIKPGSDTSTVGEDHTVTATVTSDRDRRVADIPVEFLVTGQNDDTGMITTDAVTGEATFTYTGDGGAGTDTIQACFADQQEELVCATATKDWLEPTPTPTPAPTPSLTPAAVLSAAALPDTGGTPSEGTGAALPWLAAIAGALALMGAGSGLWLAYQRRRVR